MPISRKAKFTLLFSALLSVGGLTGGRQAQSQMPTTLITPTPSASTNTLTLLSYNIHGLPWPFTSGRPAAFVQIADRLRDMRRTRSQPAVVALQEAFSGPARQIGAAAGYRYIVDGPTASDRSKIAMTPADRKFAATASWLNGETLGPIEGSGLQILSDYPILSVRRAVFPRFACAGYDCLANKGVLLVTIKVPGQSLPVEIATAHMNSRGASGVRDDRTSYAYQRQVDALSTFFRTNSNSTLPLIFAGDFNIGKSLSRQVGLRSRAGDWLAAPDPVLARGSLRDCMEGRSKRVSDLPDAQTALRRAKDWQFAVNAPTLALTPIHIFVPFGTERNGTMLSDHVGYAVQYRFAPRRLS